MVCKGQAVGDDMSFCLYVCVVRDKILYVFCLYVRKMDQYQNSMVSLVNHTACREMRGRGSRMCYAMSSLSCKKGVGEWMERGHA